MIVNEKERLQLEEELLMTCSKAQAINKYIDELEECSKLSELWCKSQQENARLKDKINMAIKYYELNQQECVIGRNKDDKLIKEYYLPAQCSKKMLDILKEN